MNEPTHPSADVVAMLRYDANRKSAGVAYLLWFFLGGLGVHRFYVGSTGVGIVYVVLFLLGLLLGKLAFFITVIMLDRGRLPACRHRAAPQRG